MRIVALLTVRNEERYIKRCLEHLHQEGIEVCLIDNGSTDKTVEIAKQFTKKNVIRIEQVPYNGSFALKPILENEARLSEEIEADWFIHHDADEIRQAPAPYKSLKEAISEVDRQGYNAINFDEFVFLPTVENPNHEGGDFVASMRHYYFFEHGPLRRINAWKNFGQKVDIASSGGHKISFADQKIFPKSFIMRHYIVLSKAHAISKFCGRVYSESEVIHNFWHGVRASCRPEQIKLPKNEELIEIQDIDCNIWNKSIVWKQHFFVNKTPVSKRKLLKQKISGWAKFFQPASAEFSSATNLVPDNHLPAPFIVGVGRSGSTLLRLMFDSHPEMAIPPETHFIPDVIAQIKKNRSSKKQFFRTLINHPQWPDFHISNDVFQSRLDAIEGFNYSEGLRAFYTLYAEKFDKKRWGDKTPPYDHHMPDIKKVLPEARFIHTIRDGRDVAISRKGKWFSPNDDIEALANYWVWRVRETRRHAQHLLHYTEVRFEDLIDNPERELKRLCAFIELPFSPQMLEYYKFAEQRHLELENRYNDDGSVKLSKEKRLKIFELTSKPPDKTRVQSWRREMSAEDQSKFEAIAGDLLRDLGY